MATVFSRTGALGTFALRTVDPAGDAPLLHAWLTHPKSVFWMMGGASRADVETEFAKVAASSGHSAYLGLHNGRPAFLAERYDPAAELGHVYSARPGDAGMHFLVAPSARPVHGFTSAVLATVLDMVFADPGVRRVVVEPDVRNTAVHRRNAEMGFTIEDTVELPGKSAYLSVCTREAYEAARTKEAVR
jgi:hypothetical protein